MGLADVALDGFCPLGAVLSDNHFLGDPFPDLQFFLHDRDALLGCLARPNARHRLTRGEFRIEGTSV